MTRLLVIIIAGILSYSMCRYDEEARIIREAEAEPAKEGDAIPCRTGLVTTECRLVTTDRLRRANVRLQMNKHLEAQLKSCAQSYRDAVKPTPAWKLVLGGAVVSALVIGAFAAGVAL